MRRIARVLGIVALVLLVAEGALRLAPRRLKIFVELGKYLEILTYTGAPYPMHLAGFRGEIDGVRWRTNDIGLRDRTFARAKPAGTLRVLALGDSITLGWGVEQDEMFTKGLERLLTQRRGAPVEVITAAVGGWNTVHEVAFLEREGLAFDPDVLLLVYVVNDNEVVTPWTEAERKTLQQRLVTTLVTNSRVGELAVDAYRWLVPPPERQPRPRELAKEPFSDADRGWRASRAALERMQAIADARRIAFAIVVCDVDDGPAERATVTALERFGREHHVPVESTYHWFDGRNRAQLKLGLLDPHPTAAAHDIMAERMADFLARVVPALGNSRQGS